MLRNIWNYLGKVLLFWLSFFIFQKLLFILVQWQNIQNESIFEILKLIFIYSLDLSIASYFLIVPFILLTIQLFISKIFIDKIIHYYHYGLILISALITAIDCNLALSSWETKINAKAFLFLNTPSMLIGSIDIKYRILFLFLLILVSIVGYSFYKKFIKEKFEQINFHFISYISFILVAASLIIVGIRGGLQEIPVNQSHVYYSTNPILNTAAVNSIWNLGNSIFQNKQLNTNSYKKIDNSYAQKLVTELFETERDSTIYLFNIEKPNIVFITLEGVNANVLPEYGSKENYAPNLQSLIENEAYSFSKMYSSGYRTDQGLAAIMSGFPAQPLTTISAQPEKYQRIASLPHDLQSLGYDCHFYFAGEAEFGSFKSYLLYNKFEPIVDYSYFEAKELTQKLGAPDAVLFNKVDQLLTQAKEPFYAHIMTQTTHEPYDMPFNNGVLDDRTRYLNTVHYTDSVLGHWIAKSKQQHWYENTIFIVSSDHSHKLPDNYWFNDPKRFHIPFLIFGKPLREQFIASRNEKYFSQTDIPASLLRQLGKQDLSKYIWSKNMMNPYSKEFAFYVFVNGYVLLQDSAFSSWEYNYDVASEKNFAKDSSKNLAQGQAYMQLLFEQYLAL